MLYAIKARYIPQRLDEFYARLKDGSIQHQKPDGEEICAAMQRAKVTASGVVQWTEICYCPTPLAHERATIYDHFFTDLHAEAIESPVEFEGRPFCEILRSTAGRQWPSEEIVGTS